MLNEAEEKACQTVQKAFDMHEPTKKMVIDRFWPYYDKVRESMIGEVVRFRL